MIWTTRILIIWLASDLIDSSHLFGSVRSLGEENEVEAIERHSNIEDENKLEGWRGQILYHLESADSAAKSGEIEKIIPNSERRGRKSLTSSSRLDASTFHNPEVNVVLPRSSSLNLHSRLRSSLKALSHPIGAMDAEKEKAELVFNSVDSDSSFKLFEPSRSLWRQKRDSERGEDVTTESVTDRPVTAQDTSSQNMLGAEDTDKTLQETTDKTGNSSMSTAEPEKSVNETYSPFGPGSENNTDYRTVVVFFPSKFSSGTSSDKTSTTPASPTASDPGQDTTGTTKKEDTTASTKPDGSSTSGAIDPGSTQAQRPQKEESFFGRHGVTVFAITLAVAVLLLYALLMVIFMPKIMGRCHRQKATLQGDSDKATRYNKKGHGIEESAPMTLLTDGNAQSDIHVDESTTLSAQSDNRSFEDDNKDPELMLGVSTFLLRNNSITEPGHKYDKNANPSTHKEQNKMNPYQRQSESYAQNKEKSQVEEGTEQGAVEILSGADTTNTTATFDSAINTSDIDVKF